MTTEVEFQKFLEKAIWEKTWEDEEDEDAEIQSFQVLTFEDAGMLTTDKGLVVIAPDRSTFTITIQRNTW
ncbi:hypothetical protein SAMN04488589_0614 [Methanolobus vulcani]|uniref:Uncharacterized protein n=1 Tax=Methanolobus vulcani TaxID=38026 RepID=A0A7Z7FBT0_9EURY|nr:hypothetical protein [Methanolobus vulcani]SDF46856.1 hypothetical protein SAMN04488589_0614 [Methanolobus vulcani]